ncbi:MAG: arsenate reductase ArsC [Candidatus Eisenbacteria bacterium]|nr:arsenate reductase ArsC [Candidatus Eisenbacteria bacterium]
MTKVLFVCTHNSARSQLAEAMLRAFHGDAYEAASAGTEAAVVNPLALQVLEEIGVGTTGLRSKDVAEFDGGWPDVVVTVCDRAKEACPVFYGAGETIHRSFEDPAAVEGTREERLAAFRKARDEIRTWIEDEFVVGR